MTDEKKDEKIEVTEKQVAAVDKEVTAKTDAKIEEKVNEVKAEVAKSNDALKEELAKIKADNERIDLEQQINMEREKAKTAAAQPVQKQVVQESNNPTQPTETIARELSRVEEWAAFEQATREGGMSADTRDIAKLPKKQD